MSAEACLCHETHIPVEPLVRLVLEVHPLSSYIELTLGVLEGAGHWALQTLPPRSWDGWGRRLIHWFLLKGEVIVFNFSWGCKLALEGLEGTLWKVFEFFFLLGLFYHFHFLLAYFTHARGHAVGGHLDFRVIDGAFAIWVGLFVVEYFLDYRRPSSVLSQLGLNLHWNEWLTMVQFPVSTLGKNLHILGQQSTQVTFLWVLHYLANNILQKIKCMLIIRPVVTRNTPLQVFE